MNRNLIGAKIFDIKSQLMLLEAQAAGEVDGEQIRGAIGVEGELAQQLDFQRARVAFLEGLLELRDETAIKGTARETFTAWVAAPNVAARVELGLIAYALKLAGVDELMAQLETAV